MFNDLNQIYTIQRQITIIHNYLNDLRRVF